MSLTITTIFYPYYLLKLSTPIYDKTISIIKIDKLKNIKMKMKF